MSFFPVIFQCFFPKNRNILLRNSTIVKIRKLAVTRCCSIIYRAYADFVNCPNNILYS